MATNATIASMNQVQGYEYNAKSLRDSGAATPKSVDVLTNGDKSVVEAQSLAGRNSTYKAPSGSFAGFRHDNEVATK